MKKTSLLLGLSLDSKMGIKSFSDVVDERQSCVGIILMLNNLTVNSCASFSEQFDFCPKEKML